MLRNAVGVIRKLFSLTDLAWIGLYVAFVVLVFVLVLTSSSDMHGIGLLLIAYPARGLQREAIGNWHDRARH